MMKVRTKVLRGAKKGILSGLWGIVIIGWGIVFIGLGGMGVFLFAAANGNIANLSELSSTLFVIFVATGAAALISIGLHLFIEQYYDANNRE